MKFFLRFRSVLMIIMVAFCVNLRICTVFMPVAVPWLWRLALVCFLFAVVAMALPPKLQLIPVLLGSVVLLLPTVLYTAYVVQFRSWEAEYLTCIYGAVHSVFYVVLLLCFLRIGKWEKNHEFSSGAVLLGLLLVILSYIASVFLNNLVDFTKLVLFAYGFLAMLAWNRRGWILATGGKETYSGAMQWQNRIIAILIFVLALMPAYYFTPMDLVDLAWQGVRKVSVSIMVRTAEEGALNLEGGEIINLEDGSSLEEEGIPIDIPGGTISIDQGGGSDTITSVPVPAPGGDLFADEEGTPIEDPGGEYSSSLEGNAEALTKGTWIETVDNLVGQVKYVTEGGAEQGAGHSGEESGNQSWLENILGEITGDTGSENSSGMIPTDPIFESPEGNVSESLPYDPTENTESVSEPVENTEPASEPTGNTEVESGFTDATEATQPEETLGEDATENAGTSWLEKLIQMVSGEQTELPPESQPVPTNTDAAETEETTAPVEETESGATDPAAEEPTASEATTPEETTSEETEKKKKAIKGFIFIFWVILVVGIVASGVVVIFLNKVLRNNSKKKGKSEEDFSDELSRAPKKKQGADDKESSVDRRKRIFGRMTPAEKIRYRYGVIAKNRDWKKNSTARENLHDPAASLYEQARYSTHPITEKEVIEFKKSTRR